MEEGREREVKCESERVGVMGGGDGKDEGGREAKKRK